MSKYKHLKWQDNFNGLLWNEVLNKWNKGDIPSIPYNINKPFLWRTSYINKEKNSFYREEFIEDKRLKNLKTDYKNLAFLEKPAELNSYKNKNKSAITISSLGKDSKLIIPTIKKNKDFTNIFHFMKNADIEQQKIVWKLVVKETNNMLKKYDKLWINTQGLGVYYLHIRIDTKPKYYEDSVLKINLENEKIIKQYTKYLKEK